MGLQSQLNDFSSDSIPLFFLALLAAFLNRLRSLLRSIGVSPFTHSDDALSSAVGSALANHLHLNRIFSYRYGDGADDVVRGGADCVVCLCSLSAGDRVRRLACRHVFHKNCFDGWLHQLSFNCPLCRSPIVSEERVPVTLRRVGEDLVTWFSIR